MNKKNYCFMRKFQMKKLRMKIIMPAICWKNYQLFHLKLLCPKGT